MKFSKAPFRCFPWVFLFVACSGAVTSPAPSIGGGGGGGMTVPGPTGGGGPSVENDGGTAPIDAGALLDAGLPEDAGVVDAGVTDSGVPMSALGCDNVSVPVGAGGQGARSVSGIASYEYVPAVYDVATDVGTLDFAKTSIRPMRGITIVLLEGTSELARVTTTATGAFTLRYDAADGADLTLAATSVTQQPCIQVKDNTDDGAVYALTENIEAGESPVNLRATHGWTGKSFAAAQRTAAPFAIADSMYTASRALLDARPALPIVPLTVFWSANNRPETSNPPRDDDLQTGKIGTSFSLKDKATVYVLGKDGADADEFDDHVIVHEWGHFVTDAISRADSIGGPHSNRDQLDPRVSFNEAFGNALSAMVLESTVYVDTSFGNGGALQAFGFDLENTPNPSDEITPAAFSEGALNRFLYDVYDPANEPFDNVSGGLGVVCDMFSGPLKSTAAFTTVAPFIAGLRTVQQIDGAALDGLLTRYKLGPITSDFGNGDDALRAMYEDATALPYTSTIDFTGGIPYNNWRQNQYYVVRGSGKPIAVKATAGEDIALSFYAKGKQLAFINANKNMGGTESATLNNTTVDAVYLVVVTGFASTAKDYPVTVSIE
jgi:hypothetical protein